MKTALITGVTGQDGSYLADYLLTHHNYTKIVGLYRRSSHVNSSRINHIKDSRFILEEFDLLDPASCNTIIKKYHPQELYNLAAQSHVGTSFSQPELTNQINYVGVLNLLESIKNHSRHTRFYQASTSEMFGANYTLKDGSKYQDENTEFKPQSPYGISKLSAHHLVRLYREIYNLHASCGILFNHESPRRGENFVTKKITKYIGQQIAKNSNTKLKLGNLNAYRDWGHAYDYVVAMFLMLQQNNADDYVIATGQTHSVKEFLEHAFDMVGLIISEKVEIDPTLYRPCEVDYLKGDSSKAKSKLGWKTTYTFETLIKDMLDSDIKYYASES